jgi:hypothetical protein
MTLQKPPPAAGDVMPAVPNKARAITGAETLAIAIAAIVTIAFTCKLLMRSDRSFDFTDEGFYLNWISHPANFKISLTQFGYIYHPLYKLVGSSVTLLRQSNILISFFLAMTACLCLLRRCALDAGTQFTLSFPLVGLSIVAANTSLLILVLASSVWLPSPSYNSLTFHSLLVAAIGFCLVESRTSRTSVAGWVLIGVGGFLAFMGKPTSAVVLGIVTLFGLFIGQRLRWRMTAISIAIFGLLLGAYAWLIGGSIERFVLDLRQSIDASSILEPKYAINRAFRFDEFHLAFGEICVLVALTLWIVALTLSTYSRRLAARFTGTIVLWILIAMAFALSTGIFGLKFQDRDFQGLQFLALVLAGMTSSVTISLFMAKSTVSRQHIASAVFFGLLPLAFAAGTANNFWRVVPSAAFFFTLASFSLIGGRSSWRHLLPLALSSLVMTIVIVEHGMEHPYRDPSPLTSSTVPVKMGQAGGMLLLGPTSAAYLEALRQISSKAGFQAGTPVIDLTGHYPGSLYAIDAKPVGAAWLIGGYPGSNKLAAFNLDLVSCQELVRSWVLTEPDGPLQLSVDLLERYSIDLRRDFEILGTLDSPIGAYPKSYKQELLKPKRDPREAVSACEKARAEVN